MKKTIVIACTHPLQPTGYARVGCSLANGLSKLGWRVVVYGFQNMASVSERYLDPRVCVLDAGKLSGNPMGFGETVCSDILQSIQPDVFVVYNDVFVINSYLDSVTIPPGTKVIAYLDLVHSGQSFIHSITHRVDQVWVFSECWVSEIDHPSVYVIPHGLDPCFVPLDPQKSRTTLNLPRDGFIVLNSNRNSYRKALDVSIRVFLEAYVELGKPSDLYLFMNCTSCDTGYDIRDLINRECRRLSLDHTEISQTRILGMQNSGFLSDMTLNMLYNACDVGLNTSVGEGFGLMALEMGSLRKPLIVNGTGGACDLLGDITVPPLATLELCRGFIAHGGSIDIPDSKEMTRLLVDLYRSGTRSQEPPFDPSAYSWDVVCAKASDTCTKIISAMV